VASLVIVGWLVVLATAFLLVRYILGGKAARFPESIERIAVRGAGHVGLATQVSLVLSLRSRNTIETNGRFDGRQKIWAARYFAQSKVLWLSTPIVSR
jgi:hypothetical protein